MSETMHHIALTKEQGARYAILPGDPGRVEKIAAYLDNPKFIASNREFTTWEGYLNGEKVLVTSTGIGGASAAIAVEELNMVGVDTMIRVGTCGGMQPFLIPGDLAIITAAIRAEGATKEYMPIEYPAVADFNMVSALKKAADSLGYTNYTGVGQSKDSYYGQHSPERMPVKNMLLDKWNAYIQAGCLAAEMETAILYIVGAILKCRCGSIMHVASNQEREKLGLSNNKTGDTTKAILTAIEAMRIIIDSDKSK